MLCNLYSSVFHRVKISKLYTDEFTRLLTLHTATRKEEQTATAEESQIFLESQAEKDEKERIIEKRRNKSRLYPQHRNLLHNKVPFTEENSAPFDYVKTVRYNRRLYGRYGAVSNVDPRIAWPTAEDLKDSKEYESLAYPSTIQAMINEELEKIRLKEEQILQNDMEMAIKLTKMDQWKESLREKISKNRAVANAAKEKRERLVEEVRRHFGFSVDPRDERFQKLLEEKEQEEKKAAKLARKQAKHEEMIAKMLKMADDDKKDREIGRKETKTEVAASQKD